MKPGYDSRPNVPAATPKRDAVRFRIFEMVYSGKREHLCRADVDRGVKGYLGVVLHTSLYYRVDGKFPFVKHDGIDFLK